MAHRGVKPLDHTGVYDRHPGSVWLKRHWDRVQQRYPDQWVAVNGKGVAAAADSPEALEAVFKGRHPDREYNGMLIAFMPSKPTV
ncbi:MAG TPA: hypothetical protein PKX87_03670 [Alphaproteobacteria bacterium]|nr:hypothetical protein [Alphaproteobacteria bacterium]